MVDLPLTGGCQCGALRYEVRAAPVMIYNCHCRNCQKTSGSAFNVSVTVLADKFAFTAGEPAVQEWPAENGAMRAGWFCGDCGSRIVQGYREAKRVLSLRAGTLDDTSWVEPVGDIWTRSAQPWVKFIEGGLRAEKQPTDYAAFMARFAAQGRFKGP
jgi:hypothetical protein